MKTEHGRCHDLLGFFYSLANISYLKKLPWKGSEPTEKLIDARKSFTISQITNKDNHAFDAALQVINLLIGQFFLDFINLIFFTLFRLYLLENIFDFLQNITLNSIFQIVFIYLKIGTLRYNRKYLLIWMSLNLFFLNKISNI